MYVNSRPTVTAYDGTQLGCVGCTPSSQLGLLPSILGTAINAGSAVIGGLLGGELTSTRKNAVDRRFEMALQGDKGSLAVLKCWAGIPTPELNQYPALAADVGVNAAGTNCGMAGAAKDYAKAKYEQALAQMKIGTTLTGAGITAIGAGQQMYPGQTAPIVQALGNTGMIVLGGVVLFLLLRKRGR